MASFARLPLRLDINATRRAASIALAAALVLAGCGGATGSASPRGSTAATPAPGAIRVVTTTTVFADMVAQIGGTNVSVRSIVPKGAVVETFDPSPGDVAAVADAQLIVMNGLGLDDWLAPLIANAAVDVPTVRLAPDLPGVSYVTGEEAGEEANPHLWLNVAYAVLYAGRITEALKAAAPADAATFDAGGKAYAARLTDLDAWVRQQVATIPPENRKLVSFHEAFPYFAEAYGLEIVGSVVEVPGQDPSAGQVAALVDAIKASGAKAVFTEAQFPPELSKAIADEADVKVESNLYNDSLGDPPVDTYEGLIRWDVERIVSALK
jgi:zinc/manganese transport system substrate-binding protein/manganese/iron transport system substrate-binding protein